MPERNDQLAGSAVVRLERRLTVLLGTWAGLSLAAGGPLWLTGRQRAGAAGRLLPGIGRQAVAWGGVDAAIALWAASRSAPAPTDEQVAGRRARRMALLTGANALADVGYLAGGLALTRTARHRGDGVGIVVQGLFLLVLDVVHARRFAGLARAVASADASSRL